MRVSLLCQFDIDTAEYILHSARARALTDNGHDVALYTHPFKYLVRRPNTRTVTHGYRERTVYSLAFHTSRALRFLYLPLLALVDFPRLLFRLLHSDLCLVQKALPLGLLYALAMRALFYRGKIVFVLDDWEGVGGFASVRHAGSLVRKMLVTATEELIPIVVHGTMCVSETLHKRMMLNPSTGRRSCYLPNGASALNPPATSVIASQPASRRLCVGYVGTLKQSEVVDFLAATVRCAHGADASLSFRIVGGGPELQRLSDATADIVSSGVLELTGQVPHESVARLLVDIDICLVYLSTEYPLVLIDQSRSSTKMFEYMAHGKAIVASATGEPATVLRNGESGILAGNTPDAFAAAIAGLASNPSLLSTLQRNARADFEGRYTHQVLMRQLVEWTQKL